jgi:hypothetical protein
MASYPCNHVATPLAKMRLSTMIILLNDVVQMRCAAAVALHGRVATNGNVWPCPIFLADRSLNEDPST